VSRGEYKSAVSDPLFWLALSLLLVAVSLLAPRTGRETRRLLKKSADALPEIAEDISSSVQIQADRLSESALKNWDGTLSRLKEAIAVGIEASQRDRQATAQKDARPAPDPRPPARDSSLT